LVFRLIDARCARTLYRVPHATADPFEETMMHKEWRLAAVEANARVANDVSRRFYDKRSRRQIAVYFAHRSLASDERNRHALGRWNENLRQNWELEHLDAARSAQGSLNPH
jgi:hypothetical protein